MKRLVFDLTKIPFLKRLIGISRLIVEVLNDQNLFRESNVANWFSIYVQFCSGHFSKLAEVYLFIVLSCISYISSTKVYAELEVKDLDTSVVKIIYININHLGDNTFYFPDNKHIKLKNEKISRTTIAMDTKKVTTEQCKGKF